jgi:hypothetical protein
MSLARAATSDQDENVSPKNIDREDSTSFREKPPLEPQASGKERSPLGTLFHHTVEFGKQMLIAAVTQSKSKNKDTILPRGPLSSIEEAIREKDKQNALASIARQRERESLSTSTSALEEFNARTERFRRLDHARLTTSRSLEDGSSHVRAREDYGTGGCDGTGVGYYTGGSSVGAVKSYSTSGSTGPGIGSSTSGSAHRGSTLQRLNLL